MRYFLLPLLLVFFTGCEQKNSSDNSFSSENCSFEIPEGKQAVCGYITAPQDHLDPDRTTVRLSVAVIKSDAAVTKEPIVFLKGGPGGSAIEDAEFWLDFDIAADRDLIIYDQRGTGHSLPFLDCDATSTVSECRKELLATDINPDDYNTQSSVEDLELIRKGLGIDRWILYGISYGTALAQAYTKSYPTKAAAVVVDSVLPLNHPFFSENITKRATAFEALFDACTQESACHSAYPDLKNDFLTLVDTLNATPVTLTYTDLDTDLEAGTFQLTGELFADLLWSSLYATELIVYLPFIIETEPSNDYQLTKLLYSGFYGSDDSEDHQSSIMYFSVMGHDFTAIDSKTAILNNYLDLDEYIDTVSYSEKAAIYDICDAIVSQKAPNSFNTLDTNTIPTLVMAGALDPVTPPPLAEEVYTALNKAYLYTLDGQGHGVTTDGCGKEIMRQFIDNPETAPTNSCETLQVSFKLPASKTTAHTAAAAGQTFKGILKKSVKAVRPFIPQY